MLTLSAPPPPGVTFDSVVSNADRVPDGVIVVNNTTRNHRARGMLLKTRHGVVANNTIENSTLGGIIVTPELSWGEADYSRFLNITHNVIRGVARAAQGYGGIALGAWTPANRLATGVGHTDIVIEDNVLDDAGYAPVWLSSAARVSFQRNVISRPLQLQYGPGSASLMAACCLPAGVPALVAVYATNVTELTLADNCIAPATLTTMTRPYLLEASVQLSAASQLANRGLAACSASSSPGVSPAASAIAAVSVTVPPPASVQPSVSPLALMPSPGSASSPAASASAPAASSTSTGLVTASPSFSCSSPLTLTASGSATSMASANGTAKAVSSGISDGSTSGAVSGSVSSSGSAGSDGPDGGSGGSVGGHGVSTAGLTVATAVGVGVGTLVVAIGTFLIVSHLWRQRRARPTLPSPAAPIVVHNPLAPASSRHYPPPHSPSGLSTNGAAAGSSLGGRAARSEKPLSSERFGFAVTQQGRQQGWD